MNNDEFKKLDAFMERNVPLMSDKVSSRKINNLKTRGLLEYAFAVGLSCIIGYGVIDSHNSKLENAATMSEVVLEWDMTVDEDIDEVDAIAML